MVLRPDWILEKEQSIAKTMFMISTSFIEIFFKFPVLDLIIIVLNRFVSFNDLCLISHVLPGCKLKILKLDFLFYQRLQNYFSTSAQHTCRWGVLQTGWVCFISLEALYSCCFTAWRVRQSHENLLLGILNSTVMLLSRINTSFLLMFAIYFRRIKTFLPSTKLSYKQSLSNAFQPPPSSPQVGQFHICHTVSSLGCHSSILHSTEDQKPNTITVI